MVEGSREPGARTWIRRGSTMLTMRGTPAGWSLLTGSSAWALHHSPRAVLAMLVLELAGLAVLHWQHGRLQAGSRQGALAIVETLPDTRVVVIGADGSIEVRAGPEAPAS
jgi:hypothetical protein